MASVLVCVILVCLSGVGGGHRADPLPSTLQVRVGEDATLQCPLLDNRSVSTPPPAASTLSWYRKVLGQRPQLLLSLRSTTGPRLSLGPGLSPEKVSVAADGSLLLRRSEPGDSGLYYCGISHGLETPETHREKT